VRATPLSADARVAAALHTPLRRLRRRLRLYVAVDGVTRLVGLALAVGAAHALLDWTLRLPIDQRAAVSALLAVGGLLLLWRLLVRPLTRRIPLVQLAGRIDRAYPELHDSLSSAVQFAAGQVMAGAAPALVAASVTAACERAAGVDFFRVLDHRRARRRAWTLAGCALVVLLAGVWQRPLLDTYLQRNWLLADVPWPQRTRLILDGFDAAATRRHPLGEDLPLTARLAPGAVMPRSATLHWSAADGRRGQTALTRIGDQAFAATLPAVRTDLTLHITGGDEHTRPHRVLVVPRPQIAALTATLTPPAYTDLPPQELSGQTTFELLRGTRLELVATLNKPVVAADLVGPGPLPPVLLAAPDRIRVTWDEPAGGGYHFDLRDADGLTSDRPIPLALRVVDDEPPQVRLTLSDTGPLITAEALLPVAAAAEDAYGLSRADVLAQLDDGAPQPLGLPAPRSGQRLWQQLSTWPVAVAGAVPGRTLRLWTEAADRDPSGPNIGRSNPVELRIVSRADLLTSLQRRELDLRRDFEQVLSVQRGIDAALAAPLPESGAAVQLEALARRQLALAERCRTIGLEFARLLGERRTNRLGPPAEDRRLAADIIAPLDALAADDLPAAAAALAALVTDPTGLPAARADQAALLARMQAILDRMAEGDGLRQAVQALEEIIAAQRAVLDATRAALLRELGDLLDEPPDETPSPPR
jgi:hypothetical protein